MEKLGLIKENKIDWKKLGIALSLFITIFLFILLLLPQMLPFFTFLDKAQWSSDVRYCIEKWIPIASIECGGMAIMGAVSENSK